MLQRKVIKAKVMAIRNDYYTKYVFQNLNEIESSLYRYITVTKCPNWQENNNFQIGDEGYLEFEDVKAGDTYLDKDTGEEKIFRYDNLYFMNFIKETKDNTKEFSF